MTPEYFVLHHIQSASSAESLVARDVYQAFIAAGGDHTRVRPAALSAQLMAAIRRLLGVKRDGSGVLWGLKIV